MLSFVVCLAFRLRGTTIHPAESAFWPTTSGMHAAAPLDRGHSDRLRTFGSLFDLESDSLIFLQRTKSAPLNRGVVDEHICSTTVGCDKAKALLAVEPFDDSLCHISRFLIVPTLREPLPTSREPLAEAVSPSAELVCHEIVRRLQIAQRAGNRKGLQLRPFTPWWRPACCSPSRSRCARRCAETPPAS